MSGLDDGLFKPKHVAYLTWKCELCMATCKRNISVDMLLYAETKESTKKTKEKLDGRYKEGHERKKPK
jgi:hypothetical protein